MMATSSTTPDEEHTSELQSIISRRSRSRGRGHPARRGSHEAGYDVPDSYANLDELATPSPVQNPDEDPITRVRTLEQERSHQSEERNDARRLSFARTQSYASRVSSRRRRVSQGGTNYDFPDNYAQLDELADPSPVENPDENPLYLHKSLEEARSQEQEYQRSQKSLQRERRESIARGEEPPKADKPPKEEEEENDVHNVSRFATQLYVISYLILFSFFGTLARLGLQALTFYPGAPVIFSELWANFGGSVFMGFLSEDRMLFKE
jgi:CrcB protein